MALKEFVRIKAKDPDLHHIQENIYSFTRQLNPSLFDGAIVEATIETTTTLVNHKLSRKFQGWLLLDVDQDARVWRDSSSSADKAKHLPLKASTSVNVKLWVF